LPHLSDFDFEGRAEIAKLKTWLEKAQPRDRVVYHRGEVLATAAERDPLLVFIRHMMWCAMQAKQVSLLQRRQTQMGVTVYEYIAEKRLPRSEGLDRLQQLASEVTSGKRNRP
jgi:hypothetical protein